MCFTKWICEHLRELVPHFFDLLSFLSNYGAVKLLLYDQVFCAFIFLERQKCKKITNLKSCRWVHNVIYRVLLCVSPYAGPCPSVPCERAVLPEDRPRYEPARSAQSPEESSPIPYTAPLSDLLKEKYQIIQFSTHSFIFSVDWSKLYWNKYVQNKCATPSIIFPRFCGHEDTWKKIIFQSWKSFCMLIGSCGLMVRDRHTHTTVWACKICCCCINIAKCM